LILNTKKNFSLFLKKQMPVNFTQAERMRLLQFLNYGIGTAVNAAAIAAHMGYPIGGNQVKTRNLITECIEHDQDLIVSTLKKRRGYYRIRRNNIQELNDYLDSLEIEQEKLIIEERI
jgi:L-ribulose-5-phosphate 3-epimerase UlaE